VGGFEDLEKLFRRYDAEGRQAVGRKVALVASDQIADFGLQRKLGERFIIGIGKRGFPEGRGGKECGSGAKGIEEAIHSGYGNPECGALAFEDFIIFREGCVSDDEFELLAHEPGEDFMRRSVSRPEGGEEDVGVENGSDHGI
jgi:hypothetical protein